MPMLDFVLAFALVTAIAATGFVVVAVMWLRKLRETVSTALTEVASQQVRTAQRVGEAVAQIQKQQHSNEQQLQNLAQANMRMRQDLVNVAHKLEHREMEQHPRGDRTVH